MSDSLQLHGLQHARLPCPSPTLGACSNSCPPNRWHHLAISSSVIPFSFYLQTFSALWSFQMSQFFASGGQSIGASVSASVFPMNIQDWFPLDWLVWFLCWRRLLMYSFSNLEPVCCSMPGFNCCYLTCIQVSQEGVQMVWYSHLFKNFPVCCDLHSQWL